jgi:hypothetical protein
MDICEQGIVYLDGEREMTHLCALFAYSSSLISLTPTFMPSFEKLTFFFSMWDFPWLARSLVQRYICGKRVLVLVLVVREHYREMEGSVEPDNPRMRNRRQRRGGRLGG